MICNITIIQKWWRMHKIRSKYLKIINLPLDMRFIIRHYIHYDDIFIKHINLVISKRLQICTFYNIHSFIYLSKKYFDILNNFNLKYYNEFYSLYSNTNFFINNSMYSNNNSIINKL